MQLKPTDGDLVVTTWHTVARVQVNATCTGPGQAREARGTERPWLEQRGVRSGHRATSPRSTTGCPSGTYQSVLSVWSAEHRSTAQLSIDIAMPGRVPGGTKRRKACRHGGVAGQHMQLIRVCAWKEMWKKNGGVYVCVWVRV